MSIVKACVMCYNEAVKEVRADEKVSIGLRCEANADLPESEAPSGLRVTCEYSFACEKQKTDRKFD